MLVFGLIREDAFKIASVAAHDWSMMQDGDIHLLDLQRAKMRKNKVESHRLLSQQSLFDKSQNFYTMSVIMFETARPHVRIGFWAFLRIGAPLTLLTTAAGVALLLVWS